MTATQTSRRGTGETGHADWGAAVVRSAVARIPFYADRLGEFEGADLAALPSFTKHTTAGYGRFPLSAGAAVGAHRILATSGTTGERLFVAFDRAEWDRLSPWMEEVARLSGLGAHDVLLNTHCYGLWVGGPALDVLAVRAGAALVALGPTDPVIVVRLLADGVGTAISATPSYLRRLVEAADEEGVDLRRSGLRFGFIGAEPAEEALRRKLCDQLPADFRWTELYGLTETGGPAFACAADPAVPELTVNTAEFHAEVLDLDADVPVPPGEVGELTVTTRMVGARTPLIRYRTRDLVRAAAGSSSDVTRTSRILGRADDSLKVDGVLVYPSAVAEILTGLLPVGAEWRAIISRQGAEDELEVEIEAPEERCQAVERAFAERVGLHVTAIPVRPGQVPRSREKTRRLLVASAFATGPVS